MEGKNEGEDPTSGTRRWRLEKEKAQGKARESGMGGDGRTGCATKEAALRYRLQMTTITQAGPSDMAGVVGEWVMERIRGIAATEGDVSKVAKR